ncbi:MAG: helix-turn-helix transcriptional regulator [Pacificimonas sp.]
MAILPVEELDALIDELDDMRDAARFDELKAQADAEGYMPGDVLALIHDDGMHPLAAWRKYHGGMTQTALAEASGVTQATIARIEGDKSRGRLSTRKALAKALDAPQWTISRDEEWEG